MPHSVFFTPSSRNKAEICTPAILPSGTAHAELQQGQLTWELASDMLRVTILQAAAAGRGQNHACGGRGAVAG